MEKNKFVKNEMGVCPVCGEAELNYIDNEILDNFMVYEWECLNCGALGKEVYELVFISHEEAEACGALGKEVYELVFISHEEAEAYVEEDENTEEENE